MMQTALNERVESLRAVPARRLLGITLALRLSGAPPPDAAGSILLARYVAGYLPLAAIMPALWRS